MPTVNITDTEINPTKIVGFGGGPRDPTDTEINPTFIFLGVTTNPATDIEVALATLNGILDEDGGEDRDCGFVWGESEACGRIGREADWATGVLSDVEEVEDELRLAVIGQTEGEDTYDTASLTGSPYTVIYNRMEFKSAGTLTKVKVKTRTAGDYTLRIKSDDGSTTYQTHTIEGAAADSWITFEIDALEVISGDKYRMEIARPSGTAYAATGLYNGTYWKNNKAAFGGSEFDYTNAMGFVLLVPEYAAAGYRVAPPLSLTEVKDVDSSLVGWTQYKPAGTDIVVKFAINEDPINEPAPGEYAVATSCDPIPGISADDNLAGKWLWARQELSTTLDINTPKLQTMRESIIGNFTPTQSRAKGQTFAQVITELSLGTTYHFRAFAIISAASAAIITYGALETFTTKRPPSVSTNPATGVGQTTATKNGTLDDDGGEACDCSFEYGETTDYGKTTAPQSKRTGETFPQEVRGFKGGSVYHFRAKATNSVGTSYGADRTFHTEALSAEAHQALGRHYSLGRHGL